MKIIIIVPEKKKKDIKMYADRLSSNRFLRNPFSKRNISQQSASYYYE